MVSLLPVRSHRTSPQKANIGGQTVWMMSGLGEWGGKRRHFVGRPLSQCPTPQPQIASEGGKGQDKQRPSETCPGDSSIL